MTTRSSWKEGQLKEYLQQAPELLQDSEAVTSSHLAATAMPIDAYQVLLTTDGSANAAQSVTLPNPATAGNGIIGQRHLVQMSNRANGTDTVVIDKTYVVKSDGVTQPTSVTLAANGDWVLLEHRSTHWLIVDAKSGVVV